MRPPSALVELKELLELLVPFCRFCSEVVTNELIAAAAVVDASVLELCLVVAAVDLLAARLVSSLLNAALKLVSTLVGRFAAVDDPCRLPSNSLFTVWSTNVDKAETVDSTELAVICVGALVETLAETWVGALVLAGWVPVGAEVAALTRALKLVACDGEVIELIDITYPRPWLTYRGIGAFRPTLSSAAPNLSDQVFGVAGVAGSAFSSSSASL
jgi:hypothetical protein